MWMRSNRNPDMPAGALRVAGDAVIHLSPSLMRVIIRALVDFLAKPGDRANLREQRFIVVELLEFLKNSDVPLPDDYRDARSAARARPPSQDGALTSRGSVAK